MTIAQVKGLNVAWIIAQLVLVFGVVGAVYTCGQRSAELKDAKRDVEQFTAARDSALEQAAADSARADSAAAVADSLTIVVDTLRARRAHLADHAANLHASYQELRATLSLPAEYEPLAQAADSTISACFAALDACAREAAASDSLAATLRAEIAALRSEVDALRTVNEQVEAISETYRRMIPTAFERTRRDVIAGGVGAAAMAVVCAVR